MSLSFIFMTPAWMGIGISSFYRELEGFFRGIELGTNRQAFSIPEVPQLQAQVTSIQGQKCSLGFIVLSIYVEYICMRNVDLHISFCGDVGRTCATSPASRFRSSNRQETRQGLSVKDS